MKNFSCFILLCLAVFSGCKKEKSQNVDPDHIQQEIWSIYDADNNDTYFGIRFYDTDWYNRVILGNPAFVTLNGLNMKLNTVNSYYELNYDNEKVLTGTFVYSDVWKRVYTNTANLEKSIELPVIDTLYKDRDQVITWVGDPCSGSPEVITMHEGLILPSSIATTSQAGATSITIKAGSYVPGFAQGYTRIRIDREVTTSLQQGTQVGGKIVNRYKSKVKWVYVK